MFQVTSTVPLPKAPECRAAPDVQSIDYRFDGAALGKACEILSIIHRYRTPCPLGVEDRSDEGNLKFLSLLYGRVRSAKSIRLVLPAFPFKSPNTIDKVLCRLPDKGEEIALAHLNGLCAAIAEIYEGGAKLTIASDGLVYNDLLGVPDSDVWAYGEALRSMVLDHAFHHINFVRLRDLINWTDDKPLNLATYEQHASVFRKELVDRNTPAEHDTNRNITTDDDVCATYRGYCVFLAKDLAHTAGSPPEISKSQQKKRVERIAKSMISRGAAFAHVIAQNFSDHIRLSIHPSNGSKKISISVVPSQSLNMTPWHSSPYFAVDGRVTFNHRDKFENDADTELVLKNGQPWYYRQRSSLYSWSTDIICEPNYPCGLTARPAPNAGPISLSSVDMLKIRSLAQNNSPVILRGFSDTKDRSLFMQKAKEMGEPLPWKFGLILEVRDQGADSRGLNNVLSSEWMPFHYDGLFKIEMQKDADGNEKVVSLPPKFQFFTALTPSPKNTGYTLFTPSHLLFDNLPPRYTVEQLQRLTWNVKTPSFEKATLAGLPLVVPHFATGRPCLRYHEPWPREKTQFDPTEVEISGADDSAALCQALDSLLHDRRICYWHSWEEGDCVISDNISMLHTRSSFEGGTDRCLLRIHVD